MPERSTLLADSEIAELSRAFRRRTSWLGFYVDPREYAVEIGLRVSRQPLSGSQEGHELVAGVLLYRGDRDSRVWGARVFGGIARAFLPAASTDADRARLIERMAAGAMIWGGATLPEVLREQVYCPAAVLRSAAGRLPRPAARAPSVGEPLRGGCLASSRPA